MIMDPTTRSWYYPNMSGSTPAIPGIALYGGGEAPLQLHGERLRDRSGPAGWQIRPHRHPGLHQVFLIQSGAARISIDGARLSPALPALIHIPPLVVHGFDFAPGTEGHVLTLPAAVAPELLDPPVAGLSQWRCVPAPTGLVALCEAVLAETNRPDPLSSAALRGLALQILAAVARTGADQTMQPEARQGDRHMARFEALVARYLWDGWRVADYARALGVSATHLTRISRAEAGQPPARLIEVRRLQEARRLLAYTSMGVAEAGHALGYEDPAYFSRAFRRAFGESPTEFRRRVAGSDLPQR